jgi:hypothetical protein
MHTSSLTPLLEDSQWDSNRRYERLPSDVLRLYSQHPDCAFNLVRMPNGVAALLEPLGDFGQRAWSYLAPWLARAYFVDKRFSSTRDEAGSLYVVVPVEAGYVSVWLLRGMHSSVYEQNDGGKTLRHATATLPEFLRRTMQLAAMVGIHHTSPYLEVPDVRWFYGCEIGAMARLDSDIRGALCKKAAAKFGERWDRELHLLARDDEHTWSLFADLSETSEGAIWVALGEDFKDVRRVIEPRAAYEAMLVHYLGGARTAFDFRPYAETQSIW